MMILKVTSFLEGHKRNMDMTFRITPNRSTITKKLKVRFIKLKIFKL
jgi:hypothetical protein